MSIHRAFIALLIVANLGGITALLSPDEHLLGAKIVCIYLTGGLLVLSFWYLDSRGGSHDER